MDGTIPGRGLGGGLGEHTPAGACGDRTRGASQSSRDTARRRRMEQYRLPLRRRAGGALRRVPAAAPPAQGIAAVARGGFRRLPAGADRSQDSRRLLLRLRIGLLLGALRPADPQCVAGPGVDETRDSGRILHQDRRRMSRSHDSFQRRDEIGRLRSGAGLSGGRRRVVFRLLGVAPHEGRRAYGDDPFERRLDLRRLGVYHGGPRGGRRRPETLLHRFAGADRRGADDLPDAVARKYDSAPDFRRSPCGAGGRRRMDRRHDRHHVGRGGVEYDRRRGRPSMPSSSRRRRTC